MRTDVPFLLGGLLAKRAARSRSLEEKIGIGTFNVFTHKQPAPQMKVVCVAERFVHLQSQIACFVFAGAVAPRETLMYFRV